jgi:hypothetical protein
VSGCPATPFRLATVRLRAFAGWLAGDVARDVPQCIFHRGDRDRRDRHLFEAASKAPVRVVADISSEEVVYTAIRKS